jgi:hypothetical protein
MVDNKEFRVDDIQLGNNIEIKIYDTGKNPVVGEQFSIVVDNGSPETMETDDEGIIEVTRPTSQINLTLADSQPF